MRKLHNEQLHHLYCTQYYWGRDGSVSIARPLTDGFRFPAEARDFLVLHAIHTAFGVHSASYAICVQLKRPQREADHTAI